MTRRTEGSNQRDPCIDLSSKQKNYYQHHTKYSSHIGGKIRHRKAIKNMSTLCLVHSKREKFNEQILAQHLKWGKHLQLLPCKWMNSLMLSILQNNNQSFQFDAFGCFCIGTGVKQLIWHQSSTKKRHRYNALWRFKDHAHTHTHTQKTWSAVQTKADLLTRTVFLPPFWFPAIII